MLNTTNRQEDVGAAFRPQPPAPAQKPTEQELQQAILALLGLQGEPITKLVLTLEASKPTMVTVERFAQPLAVIDGELVKMGEHFKLVSADQLAIVGLPVHLMGDEG